MSTTATCLGPAKASNGCLPSGALGIVEVYERLDWIEVGDMINGGAYD